MSVKDLVLDLRSAAQQLKRLNELDRSSLSVDDAVYVLQQMGLSELEWKERGEIADRFTDDYISSLANDEELIDAISKLENRKASSRVDLSKHKKVILKVLNASTDKSVRHTISKWEIAWNREEVSQLPQTYLDEQMRAYWRTSVQFDTNEEDDYGPYERPRNIQCSTAELFWITIMMDRAAYTEANLAAIFTVYMQNVNPRLLHLPVKIRRFSAGPEDEDDILKQMFQYYKAETLSPVIGSRQVPMLVPSSMLHSDYYEWSDECSVLLGQGEALHIEAPHMSYFFGQRILLTIEGSEQDLSSKAKRGTEYERKAAMAPESNRVRGREGWDSWDDTRGSEKWIEVESSDPCTYLTVSTPWKKADEASRFVTVYSVKLYGEAISLI